MEKLSNQGTSGDSTSNSSVGWVRDSTGNWARPEGPVPATTEAATTIEQPGWVRDPNSGNWVRPEQMGQSESAPVAQAKLELVGKIATSTPVSEQTGIEKDQMSKNLEILAQSELGVLYQTAYLEAVKRNPELADMLIVPYDEQAKGARGSAFARGSDTSESGKNEIHVRLGGAQEKLELLDDTLEDVSGLREFIADRLMIEPEELTSAQLDMFIFLHEIGHLDEFSKNKDQMSGVRERQKTEKANLPLGGMRTSEIINPNSKDGKWVRENFDQISKEYGVSTIEELAELTNNAHRNMTSERHADDFATDILLLEPNLVDQLAKDGESRSDFIDQYGDNPYAQKYVTAA